MKIVNGAHDIFEHGIIVNTFQSSGLYAVGCDIAESEFIHRHNAQRCVETVYCSKPKRKAER